MSALDQLIRDLKPGAEALDFGCFGWSLHARAQALGRADIRHSGADTARPAEVPANATFYEARELKLDCGSDRFDLVVASHILEHVKEPLALFAELARLCRPGGKIYIETPSDRALRPSSSGAPEDHACLNFWDDPTHIRPWTPAGLYRLAVSFGCRPLRCAYMTEPFAKLLYPLRRLRAWMTGDGDLATAAAWSAYGWCCHAVIEKPADVAGAPEYRYISLKGIPRGADNALKLYRELKGK